MTDVQHTCREQTTHSRYELLSLPVGVLVPVALARAAINSLLAAEEGVAGRDNTFALPEAPVCGTSPELGMWTCGRVCHNFHRMTKLGMNSLDPHLNSKPRSRTQGGQMVSIGLPGHSD